MALRNKSSGERIKPHVERNQLQSERNKRYTLRNQLLKTIGYKNIGSNRAIAPSRIAPQPRNFCGENKAIKPRTIAPPPNQIGV